MKRLFIYATAERLVEPELTRTHQAILDKLRVVIPGAQLLMLTGGDVLTEIQADCEEVIEASP